MDKKHHNWLGFVLLLIYIAVFCGLFYIGSHIRNQVLMSIIAIFTVIWLVVAAIVFIKINNKRWLRILPLQTTNAKLIDKYSKQYVTHSNRGNRHIVRDYLVFELPDGSRKTFDVTGNIAFNTSLLNEQGILKFKEYKRKIFFIGFEHQ